MISFFADVTLYLEVFGIIAIAWQWLLQAVEVQKALKGTLTKVELNFYKGKLFTCRYFFAYELPKVTWLSNRLLSNDPLTVEMETRHFVD